ncbi:hypothetical protein EMCG_03734 [[Emmonsia] crescens]|uniref:Uncharacterized protein n=1 Tax=[Emmonsia] crescens TaxID=73230 RepID=A0A0G2HVB2_9EURO|nr:hypothetical protein EMCG_03734 [Emmonsia crescens UAMH 3008]
MTVMTLSTLERIKGPLSVLEHLIELGTDLHAKHETGWTYLYFDWRERYVRKGREFAIHLFRFNISDGGPGGVDRWTSLFVPCRNGSDAIVEILLEHSVDVNDVTNDGFSHYCH